MNELMKVAIWFLYCQVQGQPGNHSQSQSVPASYPQSKIYFKIKRSAKI